MLPLRRALQPQLLLAQAAPGEEVRGANIFTDSPDIFVEWYNYFLKVSNILTEAECFVGEFEVVFPKLESVSKLIKISRSSSLVQYTVQYSTVQYSTIHSTDTDRLRSDSF